MRPGARLASRYTLEAALGSGSAGTTYRARDEVTGRAVALKIVRRGSPALLEVLRQEFLALRGLRHPNLSELFDFARQPSVGAFYTARLIEGSDLLSWSRGRSWSEVAETIVGIVRGLACLHARNTVHGDVAPKNILVSPAGHATLIDLSCARRAGSISDELAGTRDFIAPEVFRGEPITPLADLFALGVTLRSVSRVAEATVAQKLAPLVTRLTAPDPRERPSSTAEVLDLLGVPPAPLSALTTLRTDLAGRDEALSAFERFLGAFVRGSPGPRILHLRGHDGSGRTRLFEELKWRAQERIVVVEGRARRGVLDMIATALGHAPSPGASTATLVGLCDELSLGRFAGTPPILLALDDVHRLSNAELFRLTVVARSIHSAAALLTTGDAPLPITDNVIEIPVEPLSRQAVAAWIGNVASATALDAILRSTRGYPKAIASLLSRAGTAVTATFVEKATRDLQAEDAREIDDPEERQFLANLLVDGEAPFAESDEPVLTALALRGWIRRDAHAWVLDASPASVRAALPSDVIAAAHRDAAEAILHRLGPLPPELDREHGEAIAELLFHYASAADEQAAISLTARAHRLMLRMPSLFRRACAVLVETTFEPRAIATAATVLERCGEAALGLRSIVTALWKRPESSARASLQRAAAACYARLGDIARSERYLRRALVDESADERARAAADLSLALLRRGRHAESVKIASSAVSSEHVHPDTIIDLACNPRDGPLVQRRGRTRSSRDRARHRIDREERPRPAHPLSHRRHTRAPCVPNG